MKFDYIPCEEVHFLIYRDKEGFLSTEIVVAPNKLGVMYSVPRKELARTFLKKKLSSCEQTSISQDFNKSYVDSTCLLEGEKSSEKKTACDTLAKLSEHKGNVSIQELENLQNYINIAENEQKKSMKTKQNNSQEYDILF